MPSHPLGIDWYRCCLSQRGSDCGHKINPCAKKIVGLKLPDRCSRKTVKDLTVGATEVKESIKRMKSGKATGPEDIDSELWKAKTWDLTLWLTEFFNRVIQDGRTPSCVNGGEDVTLD